MKNEARRHHYISQFYLKGFGKIPAKNPQITVINLDKKNYFVTTANNLANIRDFNRINVPNMRADAIEKILSDFETKAADAIREVQKTKLFEGDNSLLILELMAVFTSRNPGRRENTTDFMSRIFETTSATILRYDAEFKRTTEDLAAKLGADVDKMSTHELNHFLFEKTQLKLSNEYHLQTESKYIETIFITLTQRKWVLVQASEQTGPIIASDNPVILCWNNSDKVPAFVRNSPGHAMQNTAVFFALSQHLLLIGVYDDSDNVVLPPNESLVAHYNTISINSSNKQIYVPNFDFRIVTTNEGIQDGHWLKGKVNLTKK